MAGHEPCGREDPGVREPAVSGTVRRHGRFLCPAAGFLDETVQAFDREVQFYLAYLEFIAPFRRAGLAFCYPELTRESKATYARGCFDLALAHKLVPTKGQVVDNDFHLQGQERVIVVTGPNQGGKTTFARAFAQIHVLASLGCPVPGREARLFLFDRICTHFEQEEAAVNLRGKLQDELVRMHDILGQASSDSLIVINEIFAATTWQDATTMARQVIARILELDAICVCVTFLDELAAMGERRSAWSAPSSRATTRCAPSRSSAGRPTAWPMPCPWPAGSA